MNWLVRYFRIYFIFYSVGFYTVHAADQILLDRIIVTIDKEIILESELEELVGQVSRAEAMEYMIINKILLIKAKKEGISIPKEAVHFRYKQIMEGLIQQEGSEEALERKVGMPIAMIKKDLIKDIQKNYLIELYQGNIYDKITASPAEVRDFFNKIPPSERPYRHSSVEVRHLVIYPKIGKQAKEAIITKLQSLKKQIEDGADFKVFARVYSEDFVTASKGGTTGLVTIGTMLPAYETAVLSLDPKMISDPIETEYGFYLIQLLEKKSDAYNARHILIKNKPSAEDFKKVEHQLNNIRFRLLNKELSFEEAVVQYSEDFWTLQQGGLLTNSKLGGNLIPQGELPPDLYFTIENSKMEVGDVSLPFSYTDIGSKREGRRIIFLKRKVPSHIINLEQDYEEIYSGFKKVALQKWAKGIKDEFVIHIHPDYQNYVPSFYESMEQK